MTTISRRDCVKTAFVIGAGLFYEAQQSARGWCVVFDGTSLDAWRGYKTDEALKRLGG